MQEFPELTQYFEKLGFDADFDTETYPGSVLITLDGIKCPLLAASGTEDAMLNTLKNYAFSFADIFTVMNPGVVDSAIDDVINKLN